MDMFQCLQLPVVQFPVCPCQSNPLHTLSQVMPVASHVIFALFSTSVTDVPGSASRFGHPIAGKKGKENHNEKWFLGQLKMCFFFLFFFFFEKLCSLGETVFGFGLK